MDHVENGCFFQSNYFGVSHSRDSPHAPHLSGNATFTEECIRSMNCDDNCLAFFRSDRDLYLAALKVKDCFRSVALRKDNLALTVLANAATFADLGKNLLWIE